MEHTIDRLPDYLKRFCAEQDYDKYTSREHATWRCIMRQNKDYFASHAVDVYLDGLTKTGIPTDRIPNIREMDEKLSEFGYGAVGVVGFIPPSIFLEFQSLGIMPIATDIRTLEHIDYTPAPDIVHEAAGHVPVVIDPDYRNYLSRYGQIANKALTSIEDIRRYEAIRLLSDIKENPDTKEGEIAAAEKALVAATQNMSFVSESTKVGRMGWWTIEYGLVGQGDQLKIYGAGLLSSVSESQNCLSNRVEKRPLTVECVNVDFDITEPQPQLFVVPSLKDLSASLIELEESFAFRMGGLQALDEGKKCKTVNTVRLDSGVEFCGVITTIETFSGEPSFVKVEGASQICFQEKVLPGHNRACHAEGFSSPIGRWKAYPETSPALLDQDALSEIGLIKGQKGKIEFHSGFQVEGLVKEMLWQQGRLIVVSFTDCTVKKGEKIYFDPDWGDFDLAVGSEVVSVFSGPGDRAAYGEYDIGFASSNPGRTSPFTDFEQELFAIYQKIRDLRAQPEKDSFSTKLDQTAETALNRAADEWLIYLELIELAKKDKRSETEIKWLAAAENKLLECRASIPDGDIKEMISRGHRLSK